MVIGLREISRNLQSLLLFDMFKMTVKLYLFLNLLMGTAF